MENGIQGVTHSYDKVVRSLSNKRDCQITERTRNIMVLSNTIETKTGDIISNPDKNHDLGNSSWGKIDYLQKIHGYRIVKVGSFSKRRN